jgi:hypothetical protein
MLTLTKCQYAISWLQTCNFVHTSIYKTAQTVLLERMQREKPTTDPSS